MYNIFSDEIYNKYFINAYFSFIPMQSTGDIAITNKFTMKSYLNSFNYKIISIQSLTEEEKTVLKYGLSIFGSIHEVGHNITNNLYYMSNCSNQIETPRNENLKEREGGEYMELIFFGKVMNELNIKQAFYLLNENNYKKNCFEFQKGFEELQIDDLINENGIFRVEMNQAKSTLKKNIEFNKIFIKAKNSLTIKGPYIYCSIKNDIPGRKKILK